MPVGQTLPSSVSFSETDVSPIPLAIPSSPSADYARMSMKWAERWRGFVLTLSLSLPGGPYIVGHHG